MNKALLASVQPGQLIRLPGNQQVFRAVVHCGQGVEVKPLYGTDHVVVSETATRTVQKRGFVPNEMVFPREVWILDPIEEQVALNGGKTPRNMPCRSWRRTPKCRVDDNH